VEYLSAETGRPLIFEQASTKFLNRPVRSSAGRQRPCLGMSVEIPALGLPLHGPCPAPSSQPAAWQRIRHGQDARDLL